MKLHGEELRRVVLCALEVGKRRSEVAQTLGGSIPTLDRWQRLFRESGQQAPQAHGHRKGAFSPEH